MLILLDGCKNSKVNIFMSNQIPLEAPWLCTEHFEILLFILNSSLIFIFIAQKKEKKYLTIYIDLKI